MRAIQFTEFGGPEVLHVAELPDPEPGPGQIRIAVRAAGINPIDWKVRRGMMGGELPQLTGREASGVVEALGEGVTGTAIGDEVFGFVAPGAGGAAQRTLLSDWAPIPPGLDPVAAGGLPVAIETAARTLDLVRVAAGETVVVNGAAGAVGSSAVQIARLRGARVIGTASPANHDRLRALGAEPTTYGDGLADRVRAISPGGVDAAVDAAGGGALPDLVALTGGTERVVSIADYEGVKATGVPFSGGPSATRALYALRDLGAWIAQGFTPPPIQTFPLAEIAAAHALSETGHPDGKLVLLVD